MRLKILLVALLLGGCAIPASKPALAPTSATALGLVGAAAPAIDAQWWRVYDDPQLDRVVDDALAGNPTLATALARVRQASATLASRRSDNGPNATFDASQQYARLSGKYEIPPPFAGTTRFISQDQFNLDWTLDLFGRQRDAIDAARDSTRAAVLDVTAARLALAGSVVQAYVELARAERQAAIAQATIGARANSLRLVDVRVRNRLASGLETEAARTLLAQARLALVQAQASQALAKNALAALAGRGTDYPATIAATRMRLDAPMALPATLPADLLARRADIAAALARIDAAAKGREVARKAFYPNVNLMALAGLQAIGIGNVLTGDAVTAGGGAAVHLPIFDSGRLKAQLAGATALVDLAIADYNERVVRAVREAADASARIGALDAERQRSREVVRGFSATGRLNAIRVSSGLDSKLDLVDNDVRTLAAQQDDADLAADAADARVALVMALGGGYDNRQETPR